MMVARYPHKLGWGAGMQGAIPVLAANDDWKVPIQIRMGDGVQGMIPLLAANDARNLPRRLSMGVWHPTCDTLAGTQ